MQVKPGGTMAKTKASKKRGTRLTVKTKALPKRRQVVKVAKIPSPSGPIPIPYPNVPEKKS
jgi:hypothetical protein